MAAAGFGEEWVGLKEEILGEKGGGVLMFFEGVERVYEMMRIWRWRDVGNGDDWVYV